MSASTSAAERLLEHNCHAIEAGTNLLKALANEKRLQILCLLAEKELSVTQINQQLSVGAFSALGDFASRPVGQYAAGVSNHLLFTQQRKRQGNY